MLNSDISTYGINHWAISSSLKYDTDISDMAITAIQESRGDELFAKIANI